MSTSILKTRSAKPIFNILLATILTVFLIPSSSIQVGTLTASAAPSSAVSPSSNLGNKMTLVSSSVVDGDSDVPVNVIIQLEFTDNIDDLSVLDVNKNCFSIEDESGKPLEIIILFPDTQVQNVYKKYVFITPEEPLKENSTYTLTISEHLMSKSEKILGKDSTVTFTTTSASEQAKENEILNRLGEDILEFSFASKAGSGLKTANTGNGQGSENPENTAVTTDISGSKPVVSKVLLILAILNIVIIATAVIFTLKRSKRVEDKV